MNVALYFAFMGLQYGVTLLVRWLHRVVDGSHRRPKPETSRPRDWLEKAMIRGGEREAVRVVSAWLLQHEYLKLLAGTEPRLEDAGTADDVSQPSGVADENRALWHQIALQILAALNHPRRFKDIWRVDGFVSSVVSTCEPLRDRLTAEGLVSSKNLERAQASVVWLGACAIGGLLALQGLVTPGQPFYFGMAILMALGAWVVLGVGTRVDHASLRGQHVLNESRLDDRTASNRLMQAIDQGRSIEAADLAATYGFSFLTGTDYSQYAVLFEDKGTRRRPRLVWLPMPPALRGV